MANIKSRKPTENRKGLPPKMDEVENMLTNKSEKSTGIRKDLNFKVDPEFKKRFKTYATRHDMSMVDLLMEAFEYYEVNNR